MAKEIHIQSGPYHAVVSSLGASLRRFWIETASGATQEILWGYSGDENKKGGQGDVLIPFPGRIPGGRYTFQGKSHQLELNDKEGPNAIHGFVRTRSWASRASDSGAAFRLKLHAAEMAAKGYPFSLDIGVSYQLSEAGLTCEFSVQNLGDTAAPVAVGFHPYFLPVSAKVNESKLRLPAKKLIEFGPGFIPTGRVLNVQGSPLDFVEEKRIGDTVINNCFTDLDRDAQGRAHAWLRDPESGAETRLWWSESLGYLVVYTGEALGPDARRAIAIEPMTCGTDAFNRPEWGLTTLEPLAFLTGSWGITFRSKTES